MFEKAANKSIQRTVKSGVSLRYTLLLTAADARRYACKRGRPSLMKLY